MGALRIAGVHVAASALVMDWGSAAKKNQLSQSVHARVPTRVAFNAVEE